MCVCSVVNALEYGGDSAGGVVGCGFGRVQTAERKLNYNECRVREMESKACQRLTASFQV